MQNVGNFNWQNSIRPTGKIARIEHWLYKRMIGIYFCWLTVTVETVSKHFALSVM